MNRRVLVLIATASVVASMGGVANAATESASIPASSATTRVVTAIPGIALRASVSHGNGTVTETWSAPGGEGVTYTGRPGATITLDKDNTASGGHELYFAVNVPQPFAKTDTAALQKALNAYASGERSVAQDAQNTGFAAPAVTPDTTPPFYDSWCVDVVLDSQHSEHFCDTRYIMQESGADWYLGDQMYGTTQRTGGQPLYSSYGGDDWSANNVMVQWSPTADINPSACSNITESVSYNGFGISETQPLCPDYIQPRVDNLGGAGLEEFWHGCSNGSVGFNPVDVIHSPSSATLSAVLKGYIHTEPSC